ncbi:MAG: DUF2147 domain-containing protein [Bacteroidales bacterium]|nr:DUF2147 domain-containing protein [Bacteroidales bacterium]
MRHKIIFTFLLIAFFAVNAYSQADRVVGIWLTEKKTSQVEIYKNSAGKYEGKLVWLDEPLDENGRPKTDKDNPEPSLRSRPLKGIKLLKDFDWDAKAKEWKNGTIYDPENGKTYDAYMWLDDNNTLKIKGFVMGMRFMGRSTAWTRERNVRN